MPLASVRTGLSRRGGKTAEKGETQDEEPLCAVCESSASEPLIVRKGHQVVKCGDCGLVYMSPRPRRRQELHALYTDDAYCRRQILHAGHAGRTNEAQWRLAQVERHVARRGRLLDVGCSTASFLVAARDKGWDVTGLDVSSGAIDYAKSVLGLSAVVGTLEESRLPAASFDVITVFECIEHMPDPAGALEAASRLLRPDGVLVITTPNIDGLVPRVTYHLLARTIGAWEHPTPPHHVYQFSRRTLAALLHKTGFCEVATRTRPMGLRFTVKQMQSAIIDALKRRFAAAHRTTHRHSGGVPAARPHTLPPSRSGVVPHQPAAMCRRVLRRSIAGFCWILGLTLYAVPAGPLGLGDAMLVVARKA
jgi:2-polyprenyl-3-methyl-5-hydroxy-6-metoxy-1,4-benzoquinol methylase